MAFQIRCTSCQKLYAAEERMVGKRMRCKNCAAVFTIEAPGEEPSLSAATMPGVDAHSLKASDLTGTRRAETVRPPPEPREEVEENAPKNLQWRPSVPHDFPGSPIIEAWLPLGLGLISAALVTSHVFGSNDTGRIWVSLLRILEIAGLYLGLVIPLTFRAVKIDFAKMRKMLPPSPMSRTAFTFALPAALGYELWQASGGAGGFITGLLLGLVMMAAVFWLLFRLNPEEAAHTYARGAGTFLATCGVSALLIVGASAALNRAMINGRAGDTFRESPFGAPLAWNVQTPAEKPRPKAPSKSNADLAGIGQTPAPIQSIKPKPAPDQKTQEITLPEPAPQIAKSTDSETRIVEPVSNPPKNGKAADSVFANPDDDSFMDAIRKANLPWVKSVARADTQMPFDFTISSQGQSQFVGLVHVIDGSNRRQVMLAPLNAAVPEIVDDAPDLQTFGKRFLLTDDGRGIVHIRFGGQIELIATAEDRHDVTPMEVPSGPVPLKPTLVGIARDSNVVIRWSAPGSAEQCVYRYSYLTKSKISKAVIQDPNTWGDVCAVSANVNGPVLYAWLSQRPGKAPTLKMANISANQAPVRNGSIPLDLMDITLFERGELQFSPDGLKVALVIERGNTAQVLVWPTTGTSANSVMSRMTCKSPAREMVGQVRGPALRWLNNGFFVVNGRTVASAQGGTLGDLTDAVVIGEQTTSDNKLFVSYLLPDSHTHLAVVEFDPAALARAAASRASSH